MVDMTLRRKVMSYFFPRFELGRYGHHRKKIINGMNNVSGSVKLGLQKTSGNFLLDDLFPSIVSSMVAEL